MKTPTPISLEVCLSSARQMLASPADRAKNAKDLTKFAQLILEQIRRLELDLQAAHRSAKAFVLDSAAKQLRASGVTREDEILWRAEFEGIGLEYYNYQYNRSPMLALVDFAAYWPAERTFEHARAVVDFYDKFVALVAEVRAHEQELRLTLK